MDKQVWNDGIQEEITFWDYWFNTAGLQWPDDYKMRIDPNTELQDDLKELVAGIDHPRILDVGAGPLTFMGKKINGVPVEIIPIDALAVQYDEMLARHGITPVIRTSLWHSEDLDQLPESFGKFDLIVAQNTLDHSFDPMKAIMAMPKLLNPGGSILLRHYINEAERGKYNGLHQWNFTYDEGLLLWNKGERINVTEELLNAYDDIYHRCRITMLNEVVCIITNLP